ncbi:hypothetical protein QE152_g26455 [Popillia japonica]|uniref:Uncharacterized protein n=1 Tax=Popillia japonica TaxID=7064 RepID=A0AAW1JY51_POPJA
MDEEEPNEKVEENENETENEKEENESLSKIVKEESETDEKEQTMKRQVDRRGRPVKVPKRFEEFAMLTYKEATNGPVKDLWKKANKRFEEFAMLTYKEATNGPVKDLWKKAIEEEKAVKENNRLISLKAEQCIFRNEKGNLFVAIYVSDGFIVGESENEIKNNVSSETKKGIYLWQYTLVTDS